MSALSAQPELMESAAPGLLEVGAPLFRIHGHESLGLDVAPTDLHVLPDGRVVLMADRQLAFGDGVRWEVFSRADADLPPLGGNLAVSEDGAIFAAAAHGFGQMELGRHGDWHLKVSKSWTHREAAMPRTVIDTGGEWFWHSNSGAIVAWQPGGEPRLVGQANSVQHIFRLNDDTYLSDRTTGDLWRLGAQAMEPVPFAPSISASDTITCATRFDATRVLVGTYRRGLALFDGHTLQSFSVDGVLASEVRINDVCATEAGYFAAAVENYGVVFFDRQGRTIQVLDHAFDHRLSHIARLIPARGGVIWGLLANGVLQVEFPSRISYFEPLIGSGINIAMPARAAGRLWLLADGYVYRGVYDRYGRMSGLEVDAPTSGFAANPTGVLGALLVSTDQHTYRRDRSGWSEFIAEAPHLMILRHPPVDRRWLYAAAHEVGFVGLHPDGTADIQRFAEPRLQRVYGSESAANGDTWLELGLGQLARLRLVDGRPVLDYFGAAEGVPQNWAQVFQIDGRIGFNIGDQILRFDEASRRLVPDTEFATRFPGLHGTIGRPGRDAAGRLWITADNCVQVLEGSDGNWRRTPEKTPAGFLPYYFTFERGGVVWMHSSGRLARYDPSFPTTEETPLRAAITRVITGSGTQYHPALGERFRAIPYADNSLIVHFCAPEAGFRTVSFEVMLEGESSEWVHAGSSGSAVFNRLAEGRYVLHVRPQANGTTGVETSLAFDILPPWYRTRLAYFGYAMTGVGFIWLAVWLIVYLQRRDKERLEHLVALRTRQVAASNQSLAAQVEQNQILSAAIAQSPAAVFITDPLGQIVFANPRACELAGRSAVELARENFRTLRGTQVPPAVLAEIDEALRRGDNWQGQLTNHRSDGSRVQVRSLVAPIRSTDGRVHHFLVMEEDITESLNEQDRRRHLEAQLFQAQKLESIGTLAGGIAHDFNNILTAILGFCELAGMDAGDNPALQQDISGIRVAGTRAKELVARILAFSRQNHVQLLPVDLTGPVTEALKLVRASTPSTIEIVSSLESGIIRADPTQIQQIVINLCTNAVQAMPRQQGRIEVTVQRVQVSADVAAEVPQLWVGEAMRLVISDNGCGMDEVTLPRIFDPFFTTKPPGEGTGLGLAIVQGVVAGHQGALTVRSTPKAGSTFEIYFRLCGEDVGLASPHAPVPRGEQQEILVVDDERFIADFAATRLHQLGYQPTVFTDPQEALDVFVATPRRFQAIVTDLTMPRLTGADLVRQIRARGWQTPAVIITGYQGDVVGANLRALPRSLVLPKPFSGDELGRALHQVLTQYAPPPAT